MRISIFGQRTITQPSVVMSAWANALGDIGFNGDAPITFVHGGAKGPQSVVIDCINNKYEGIYTDEIHDVILFEPWTLINNRMKFTPGVFLYRNIQIVKNSDVVILLDNGEKDSEASKIPSLCDQYGAQLIYFKV